MINTNTLILCMLFAFATAQTYTCDNDCGANGTCVTYSDSEAFCSCRSGTYDSAGVCDDNALSACPNDFNDVKDLETGNIPIAVTASFTNDQLSVLIRSPLVNQRTHTKIALDDSATDNWNCSYPGTNWAKQDSSANCEDRFQGTFGWAATVGQCGWDFDNTDANWFIYTNDMIMTHYDDIDPFASRAGSDPVIRETIHSIPLEVKFKKFVDVSTNITVNAPVTILAAISKQEVVPDQNQAIIEITTNLLYPHKLNGSDFDLDNLITFPSDKNMSYTLSDISDPADCPNNSASSCTQKFRITIDTLDECTITGPYNLEWQIICQSTDACLVDNGAPNIAQVNSSIISEDFCAAVSVEIDITGTLESYETNAYSTPRDQFVINEVAYFKATVSSPDATLTSATVSEVKLVSGGDTHIVYSSGAVQVAASQFAIDTAGADSSTFYLTLSDQYLSALSQDEAREYAVTARVDVTYDGVPSKKRMVFNLFQQDGSSARKPLSLDSQVGLQSPQEEDPIMQQASAPSLSFGIALIFAVYACLF